MVQKIWQNYWYNDLIYVEGTQMCRYGNKCNNLINVKYIQMNTYLILKNDHFFLYFEKKI